MCLCLQPLLPLSSFTFQRSLSLIFTFVDTLTRLSVDQAECGEGLRLCRAIVSFNALPRGSWGIVCEEESYRRICARLELPTVPFVPSCFATGILFFFFLGGWVAKNNM